MPGRFRSIVGGHPELFEGASVLDIGARDARLREHVPSSSTVVALDVEPGPGVGVIGSLEGGLPLRSLSFDTVLALDVLEHVDRLFFAFGEVLRVSRTNVVVALPNPYEFSSRLRFLAGRPVSGKYRLSDRAAKGGDRHRWLFTAQEAIRFVERNARDLGFAVTEVRYLTHGYSSVPMRTLQSLVERLQVGRNLFGGTVVLYLRRDDPMRPMR